MLTGFNHNIKHAGQTYHIQTEDSGVQAPHIITHLFIGGNIIATKKTSYADVLQTADLEGVVRKMMEEQHKNMLRKLIHGSFDQVLSERQEHTEQAQAAHEENAPEQTVARPVPDVPAIAATPARPAIPVTAIRDDQSSMQQADSSATLRMTPVPPIQAVRDQAKPDLPARSNSGVTPAPIDIPEIPEIPPPPMSIWEATASPKMHDDAPIPEQKASTTLADLPLPPSASTQPVMPVVEPQTDLPPEVVEAQKLKEQPKEKPASDTIFGEDLMSEKSLDEVILSYLADDPNSL